MKENPRLAVELEGYTDPSGSLEYNLALSQRRVEAVRRFLVQQGVDLRRIQAAGLGPIADSKLPADQKRRVIGEAHHCPSTTPEPGGPPSPPRSCADPEGPAPAFASGDRAPAHRPQARPFPAAPRCAICHGQS